MNFIKGIVGGFRKTLSKPKETFFSSYSGEGRLYKFEGSKRECM
jgi:hypothetical protein